MSDVNRKKLSWLFPLMTAIFVVAVWAVCFLRVNRAYPQAELIQVGINEPLQYGPYAITVNQVYMEDTIALYEENGLSVGDKRLPETMLVCAVTIERNSLDLTGSAQANLKISHIAATSGAWSNMVDTGELYAVLNNGASVLDQLQEGEQQTYLLPFGIWWDGFSANSLEHLDQRSFTLQLSLYPKKYEIAVT